MNVQQGMYYSYYKTIAESKNFIDGLTRINSDNLSEYPNVINAEAKYNLFPEVCSSNSNNPKNYLLQANKFVTNYFLKITNIV